MKVDDEVLRVLSNATTDGDALTLVGTLDRKLYMRTNDVLEAGGGKWNKKAKAHLFEGGAAEAMEEIILTGEVTLKRTIQQDFGYFPTPAPIVARLMEVAEIGPGMKALEPSAGRGNIAKALVAAEAVVDCVELLPDNAYAFEAMALNKFLVCDFLALEAEPIYDRVVMNPPFAKQADIHHVNHALKFLKPDGHLVAIMSSSVSFRDNKLTSDFRELVESRGGYIEALPDAAFKESGTLVRTVLVVVPA